MTEPKVTYEASRLHFRADVIEQLRPDEAFRVVTPEGTVQMTKRQFYEAFPNVAVSDSYRRDGHYHYPSFPEKARPFVVSE